MRKLIQPRLWIDQYIIYLLSKNPSVDVEESLVSVTTCKGASLSTFFPLSYAKVKVTVKMEFHKDNESASHRGLCITSQLVQDLFFLLFFATRSFRIRK